ncbi:serine/threonine-protein phosphatase, partial [Nocardioides hankookensis]
ELDPVPDLPAGALDAIDADPVDPEAARYAPRAPRRYVWAKRLFALAVVVGIAWVAVAALWSWSQKQYYVGEQDGTVVIFRGVNASIGGFDLSEPYQTTDVELDRLSDFDAGKVEDGIDATDLDDAQSTVQNLARSQEPATDTAGTDG